MLHKIQYPRSGGVLHGARPRWLNSIYLYILSTTTSQITINKNRSQKVSETIPQQNSNRRDVNSMKNIQSE